MLKKLIMAMVCLGMIVTSAAAVQLTAGYFGVTEYSNQHMSEVPGRQYVQILNSELSSKYNVENTYSEHDKRATKSNFGTRANSNEARTFFAWSGHGYAGASKGPLLYDGIYSKSNCHFKHLYVIMHSCNWLTNNGNQSEQKAIYNTFNGCRLQLGFASKMYLDSREAAAFVARMETQTIASAYVNAARIYQVQKTEDNSIVKVTGYKDARMDYIYSGKSAAPAYSTANASQFVEHYNVEIKRTGQKVED